MSAAEATNDAISAARFKSYDKDSDGTMDVSEVKELMVAMGFAADDAYATTALKKFDADGDGTLTAAEFGADRRRLDERRARPSSTVLPLSTL